jgi:hypothetical protein
MSGGEGVGNKNNISNLSTAISKIKSNFQEVNDKYPHINFVYLTYRETTNPINSKSIN